jgi:preprotein translocase subunit YajC
MTPLLVPALLLQAAPTGGGGSGAMVLLVQFALIFGIFYFLWIRPQQKKQRQQEERLKQLKRGDEVVTVGGIVGEIVHIAQTLKDGQAQPAMDDRITIKSGESRLVIERARIARVVGDGTPAATAAATEKSLS